MPKSLKTAAQIAGRAEQLHLRGHKEDAIYFLMQAQFKLAQEQFEETKYIVRTVTTPVAEPANPTDEREEEARRLRIREKFDSTSDPNRRQPHETTQMWAKRIGLTHHELNKYAANPVRHIKSAFRAAIREDIQNSNDGNMLQGNWLDFYSHIAALYPKFADVLREWLRSTDEKTTPFPMDKPMYSEEDMNGEFERGRREADLPLGKYSINGAECVCGNRMFSSECLTTGHIKGPQPATFEVIRRIEDPAGGEDTTSSTHSNSDYEARIEKVQLAKAKAESERDIYREALETINGCGSLPLHEFWAKIREILNGVGI